MMKYINPIESKFIDSASGIHIKFRLAGVGLVFLSKFFLTGHFFESKTLFKQAQFPPTIYYKIFTHRPVQDIGANAPRDYTRVKKLTSTMKNNRIVQPPVESMNNCKLKLLFNC